MRHWLFHNRCLFPISLLAALCASTASDAQTAPPDGQQKVDFSKQVLPLLKARCFACHAGKKQEAGFRLDVRRRLLAGGDSGPVVRPGDAAGSLLIKYISGADPEHLMPPEGEGERLSKKQVALIRAWIDQGLLWPAGADTAEDAARDHWAFQTIRRPTVPEINSPWIRNAIDAFVLRTLQREKVEPAAEADRQALIRRLSLDLLGLPPAPAEVQAFVADARPDAYQRLVDRLLKSRHFGERWGRHWLDKARYADSDGYEKDRPRMNAWRWRDWVVESINDDMPFDQFTAQQLAGDLLSEPTAKQLLATAFHRQTLTNTEGGTDQEQFRVEAVFDRVETTGTVWLGLTLTCARCHSHKYDPITQREYYQMFAFMNNWDETSVKVERSAAAMRAYETARATHAETTGMWERKLAEQRRRLQPEFTAWQRDLLRKLDEQEQNPPEFVSWTEPQASGTGGVQFEVLDDDSIRVSGPFPDKCTYTVTASLSGDSAEQEARDLLSGIRVEALSDETLPHKGPGRADNGNFVLTHLVLEMATADGKWQSIPLAAAEAEFAQDKFPAQNALNKDAKTGWAVSPQFGRGHRATFWFAEPLQRPAGESFKLRIKLDQQYGGKHTLGRFRVQAVRGSRPGLGLPPEVVQALKVTSDKRSDKQTTRLSDHFLMSRTESAAVLKALSEHRKKTPQPPLMDVRVLKVRTAKPRDTRILRRGDFLSPQGPDALAADTPSVLAALQVPEGRSANRLDFVNWLFDPQNPLTARVAVNQVWQNLFGRGLVRTVNDFGVRGERPTHPQLLDWLATEYRRLGWSRKALIKTIVMSAAYRQSSRHRTAMAQRDALNVWIHRQNRFRVEAEIVRDMSLAVAGLLSDRVGGPSTFPPLPSGVAALSYANNFKWKTSQGADRYRRGMYTFFKRTAPHPNLVAFDCPDSNTTCVDRRDSNTPLQALTTLNNEVFVEASQALAARVLSRPGTAQDRLQHAFQLCVARSANSMELEQLNGLLATCQQWYADHQDQAGQLIGQRPAKSVPADVNAAWIAVARTLLNMDEFLTRE